MRDARRRATIAAMLDLRLRWCLAVGAPIIERAGLDPHALGGWAADHIARARGADEIQAAAIALLADDSIHSRADLMAWARERLHARRDLAHVIAAFSLATTAGYVSDDDAWHVILLAGKLAQQSHASWDELAATCAPSDAIRAHWRTLPWDTELDVALVDPAKVRILRSACPTCGAPRTRPSPTAYVYCDHCGQLADYDFARACEQPLERPGPVYEALRARLAPAHEAARGDFDALRDAQRALFDAWVDACPGATPIRCRDPEYRARYVELFAEAEARAALDPEAQRLQAELAARTAALGFAEVAGRARVLPGPYRALEDAVFAHEARRHELAIEHGLYDRQPDGASPELVRRIGLSMFAQGWLPYLDDDAARALLARCGLARDYDLVDPPTTSPYPCATCGGALAIVDGARRVVCDHCGRMVAIV